MKIILLSATLAVVAGCALVPETRVQLFPDPFGIVHLGMSEIVFTNTWPEVVFDTNGVNGATFWTVGKAGLFEDSSFKFTPVDGMLGRTLSSAMLCYRPGTSFREVLADAENRLGSAPSCKTTLFCGALCFQRTWLFGWGEATLLFWPRDTDMELQWRVEETGPSSAHDDFVSTLPDGVAKGVRARFCIGNKGWADFNPSGFLSLAATRSILSALTGWEMFDPVDLESRILRGKEGGAAIRGHWLVGDYLCLEEWPIAIGEDASWVANLGSDGVARTIPESRRPVIIGALDSLTNSPTVPVSGDRTAPPAQVREP